MSGRGAVFLDRDGVLNEIVFHGDEPGSPRRLEDLKVTAGAAEALARLKAAGFMLICVTNQPELAQGLLQADALAAMNAEVRRQLPLDDLLVCPHDDTAKCDCRKPKPGMLLQAAARHGIDPRASFMVGDRWRDVEAGAAAGCRTIMIESAHRDRPPAVPPDATLETLRQAADWILAHSDRDARRSSTE